MNDSLKKSDKSGSSSGNSYIFFSSSALTFMLFCLITVVGIITLKAVSVFYPGTVGKYTLTDGRILLGTEKDSVREKNGEEFVYIETGNKELYGQAYFRISRSEIGSVSYPENAVIFERLAGGSLIGFTADGQNKDDILKQLEGVAEKREAAAEIQEKINAVDRELHRAEEAYKKELYYTPAKAVKPDTEKLKAEFETLEKQLSAVEDEINRPVFKITDIGGKTIDVPYASLTRVYYPNTLGVFGKLGIYFSKIGTFLSEYPRESNTEGGILPAIVGTFSLVIIMSIFAFPLGVLVAIYLTEYAGKGFLVKIIRISINNLAGIPSIVFGVFGLGFFVYGMGGYIDQMFFPERLPEPTFGTGGLLWASLTLSLLTVPVVIVAAEEALSAVPAGMKHSSVALGGTKLQTLIKISLPHALPGILTGFILAISRGAGEVAPLMITGVVKLAPSLPINGEFPFIHADAKFMHLGFHIYDVGFQSPDIEQAKPMVFMTALTLLIIVLLLNIIAIRLREKMRRKIHVKTI